MNCEAALIPLNSSRKERVFAALVPGQPVNLSLAPSFWKRELTCAGCAPINVPAYKQADSSCPVLNCCCSIPSSSSALGVFFTHPSLSHRAIVAACTVMYTLTSQEHFKLSVEYSKSGLSWAPQVNEACIFPRKYLKNFRPQIGNHPR